MLTKSDLIAIKNIVKEEGENIRSETKQLIQSETRKIVHGELTPVNNRLARLENKVTKMHKELKEEIRLVSHKLDKDNMRTVRRVERIEAHIGITQP